MKIEAPRETIYTLNRELITEEEQQDLDKMGVAKNAREEKIRARDQKMKEKDPAYHAEMMKLYKKHVLKDQTAESFVPLSTIAPANGNGNGSKPAVDVEEPVAGD